MLAGLLDDVPKAIFAAILAGLAIAAVRAWRAARARPAARWRDAWIVPERRLPVLILVLSLGAFAVVAEDVALGDREEGILRLDAHVRSAARPVAATPALRTAAVAVTRATGEGLAFAVVAGTAALWASRRRRDALVFLGGILGSWALAGALKLIFAVPRPSASSAVHAFTTYGFPSSHVLVTTVACGLGVWLLGRGTRLGARLGLAAGGLAVVLLTAAARVVLNAHWLSDVTGGALMGVTCLGSILLLLARSPGAGGTP
jgi:membrane-associated phospholipid phosphatase